MLHRPLCRRLLPALAVVALAVPGAARAADVPFAGTWKVVVYDNLQVINLCVVKVEAKKGKPAAAMINAGLPNYARATLGDVKIDARSVHFALQGGPTSLVITARPLKGEDNPKRLYGVTQVGPAALLTLLEKTTDTKIDPKQAVTLDPTLAELRKLARAGAAERAKALQKVLADHHDDPAAYAAAEDLLAMRTADPGAGEADLKAALEKLEKIARVYGPAVELRACLGAAGSLAKTKHGAALAVACARKAEGLLTKDDPLERTAEVLGVLAAALNKAGKAEEARAAEARAAKINEQLDEEFEKTSIPFTPAKFAGRAGKSRRVAVVELFTGAQCPPCVSADIAFDAALKTYPDADVAFLEYHLHIPGPDPLTNADTEARQAYYRVNSTPSMFLDGKATPPMGGFKQHGEERYKALCKLIDKALKEDATAGPRLKATRSGAKLDISADVSGLKDAGDKVRLRFVLVEDVARYAGRNKQRLHHHVVRAFPGGVEGQALKGDKGSYSASIDLAGLRQRLAAYLDESGKRRPYLDASRPMELRDLRVIALLQDDDSKAILQAAQAKVPPER
jgi:hypothetical protein